MEIQQSAQYGQYIKLLGWQVETIDGVQIFIRHFPFMGSLAKIQRPEKLPTIAKLVPILKSHNVRTVAIEPACDIDQSKLDAWTKRIAETFHSNKTPFLATKTILVDLKPSEEKIFHSFSEAKQRAVRRAIKNNITIQQSTNIQELIKIKNKSAGLFGFITTHGIKELWQIFGENHGAILLAKNRDKKIIGGVLLLFYDKTAYYWIAGATKEGKQLVAPTLLVWEAVKLSKKRGCNQFDFIGVWDERMPKNNLDWKGFTKFKEGFGGKEVYYPLSNT